MTAEIYQPWLEISSHVSGSFEEDVNVELDLHLADGGLVDHGDHVHDQRLQVEQEAVSK